MSISMDPNPKDPGVHNVVVTRFGKRDTVVLRWDGKVWRSIVTGYPLDSKTLVIGWETKPVQREEPPEPSTWLPSDLAEKTELALWLLHFDRWTTNDRFKNDQPFDALVRRGLATKHHALPRWVITQKGLAKRAAAYDFPPQYCDKPLCIGPKPLPVGSVVHWRYSSNKKQFHRFGVIVCAVPPHRCGFGAATTINKKNTFANLVSEGDLSMDKPYRHGYTYICASGHGSTEKSKSALYWPHRRPDLIEPGTDYSKLTGFISSGAFLAYKESLQC